MTMGLVSVWTRESVLSGATVAYRFLRGEKLMAEKEKCFMCSATEGELVLLHARKDGTYF